MTKKRILILMAKTGGGHGVVAHAIEQALNELYSKKVHIEVIDGLRDFAPFPLNRLESVYPWQLKISTTAYAASWKATNNTNIAKNIVKQLWPVVKDATYKIIRRRFDVIVATHPAFVYPCLIARQELKRNVKFVSMIPDLAASHASWCSPDADLVLVPTISAQVDAIKHGVPFEKLKVVGLPIRTEFAKKFPPKTKILKSIGLNPKIKTILAMGGGEGVGKIKDVVKKLSSSRLKNVQAIIIAGKNKNLKKNVQDLNWSIPAKVFGFTDNIPNLMHASDILLTKGGPTTIAEALASGLPMIIFDYIPAQEGKNVSLVVNANAGVHIEDTQEAVETIKKWIARKDLLKKMAKNAKEASSPEAAFTAAKIIYSL